jgi:hypothetical protein
MNRVDRAAAETMIDFLQRSDASLRVAQIRALGGAMARVPADATAFAHRDRPILTNVAAFYEGEDDRLRREAWTDAFAAALRQGKEGAYVAFLNDDGKSSVRAAYPGSTWDRLAEIKRRYDAANLFRRNHNVTPGS